MVNQEQITFGRTAGVLLVGLAFMGLAGCASSSDIAAKPAGGSVSKSEAVATPPSKDAAKVMAPAKPIGQPGDGQELFASDAEAAKALTDAAKANDREAMRKIFGPAGKELASGDRVEDRNDREDFARRASEQTRLVQKDEKTSVINVGKEDWPFPIPITRRADGKWFFDTEAGKEEILARRIGENELETIDVCRAYVQAQREYASQERDDSGVLQYAQHLTSTAGHHDGLYWEAKETEDQSPLGPLVAEARMEGYVGGDKNSGRHPFHGYYFHVLTRQGSKAAGGAYNYIINGHMIAGFALVASPDKYGSSGIMTFVVSQQGKLYQKDLGAKTEQIVHNMKEYDPDDSWTLVKD